MTLTEFYLLEALHEGNKIMRKTIQPFPLPMVETGKPFMFWCARTSSNVKINYRRTRGLIFGNQAKYDLMQKASRYKNDRQR